MHSGIIAGVSEIVVDELWLVVVVVAGLKDAVFVLGGNQCILHHCNSSAEGDLLILSRIRSRRPIESVLFAFGHHVVSSKRYHHQRIRKEETPTHYQLDAIHLTSCWARLLLTFHRECRNVTNE